MNANFGNTAQDYRKHRAGFPLSFFQRLKEERLVHGSERAVDLGTGTGTIARGLAAMGCDVSGIDPSPELLTQAKGMASLEGVEVEWIQGKAESIRLQDASVDIVTAGQCWHWFDAEAAMKEIRRILRRNGLLIIAHFDWLPIKGNAVEATEQLITQANPLWDMGGGNGIYPKWFTHLTEGGLSDIKSFSYDEPVRYSHKAWRGRIRASAGISGSLPAEKVEAFDKQLAKVLKEKFPEEPLIIPHRIFVIHGSA